MALQERHLLTHETSGLQGVTSQGLDSLPHLLQHEKGPSCNSREARELTTLRKEEALPASLENGTRAGTCIGLKDAAATTLRGGNTPIGSDFGSMEEEEEAEGEDEKAVSKTCLYSSERPGKDGEGHDRRWSSEQPCEHMPCPRQRRRSLPAMVASPGFDPPVSVSRRRHSISTIADHAPSMRVQINGMPSLPVMGLLSICAEIKDCSFGAKYRLGFRAVARVVAKELWRATPQLIPLAVTNVCIGLDWVLAPFGLRYMQRLARRQYARQVRVEAPLSLTSATTVDTCSVPGGGRLRATLILPEGRPGPFPTVLMRTPYGRNAGEFGQTLLAERGFAVLVQDTRGRFASDGTFVPIQNEREDGAATVEWILRQPWCNGRLGVTGISYLGFTAWAAMGTAAAHISAGVILVSQSRVKRAVLHPDGAISLELCLLWLYLVLNLMGGLESGVAAFARKLCSGIWQGTLGKASMHLPICELDRIILGKEVPFWREGVRSFGNSGSTFWDDKDVLCDICEDGPPVHLFAGWFDIFLEQCLEDFKLAGRRAWLTVMPCSHWGIINYNHVMMRASLETFQEHLQGRLRFSPLARVQVGILGSEGVASFEEWPPAASRAREYHLVGEGLRRFPGTAWRRSYKYDPADPTPARGGPSFNPANAGEKDQSPIEAREDVLVFTTAALREELFIAGEVTLELEVDVGSRSADFIGRLCDVSPEGLSLNRCEGLTRVHGPGRQRVSIGLGSTCCLFGQGHAIRLQVCSGAHPRWMRNLQTGEEPLATATQMEAATHSVLAGSVLRLPTLPMPLLLHGSC